MSLKIIRENALLIFVLLFLYAASLPHFPRIAFVLAVLYWFIRFRFQGLAYLIILLFITAVPRTYTGLPTCTSGIITETQNTYSVISSGLTNIILYNDMPLIIGSEVHFSKNFTPVSFPSGFFRIGRTDCFKGAWYSLNSDAVISINERISLRGWIQKRILQCPENEQKYLIRFLLNIKDQEDDGFFSENGFSFSGISSAAYVFLQYLIDEKKQKKTVITITALVCMLYRFPLLPVQSLIFQLLSLTSLSRAEKCGIGLSAIVILYPDQILTVSFLMPAVFRFASSRSCGRIRTMTASMLLSSIFFQKCEPVRMVLFSALRTACGFLWYFSLLLIILPHPDFSIFFQCIETILSFTRFPSLYGSALGFGLPCFLVSAWINDQKEHGDLRVLVLFLGFLCTGMFHPLAEVSWINVGQGDSILIREPFNRNNILIDTGKPSKYSAVETFLHGKGISSLSLMVITHADSDHSGNADIIEQEFHVPEVIRTHQDVIASGKLRFYDLNDLITDDENRNSIVLWFKLNGLRYLLTGDADQTAEERIIRRYPSLDCDVLKLSHHGSKTGSCDLFLDTVKPDLAVISSGAWSIYHHPSAETLERLAKRHIPYLDTKWEGDITILCLPYFNFLITSSGKIAIMRPS